MARRRPTLKAYLRRRWRVAGLLLVLLLGSLLLLSLTDRGHDPIWTARDVTAEALATSPDGQVVYTLVRTNDAITRLEARRGESGALIWESPMNATRALLAAGHQGVAVATDFPLAFLTVYARDGAPLYQTALEGNPRALLMQGTRVVLALKAPGDPVLVFEGGPTPTAHPFPSFITALDAEGGRVAVGTGAGDLEVIESDGTRVLDLQLPITVKAVRLTQDGAFLVAGGKRLAPEDLSGMVFFVDIAKGEIVWSRETSAAVGLVDLDHAGVRALALEEAPAGHLLAVYDTQHGERIWTAPLSGYIGHDDTGSMGGAALSPDGRVVVAATLREELRAFILPESRARWSFESAGSTLVTFVPEAPDLVVTNGRLVLQGPYDTIFLFSTAGEPPLGRLALVGGGIAATVALLGALILGAGYWRLVRAS